MKAFTRTRPARPGRARIATLVAALAIVPLLAAGTPQAGTETPESLITDLHDSLGDVMQNAKTLGYKGR